MFIKQIWNKRNSNKCWNKGKTSRRDRHRHTHTRQDRTKQEKASYELCHTFPSHKIHHNRQFCRDYSTSATLSAEGNTSRSKIMSSTRGVLQYVCFNQLETEWHGGLVSVLRLSPDTTCAAGGCQGHHGGHFVVMSAAHKCVSDLRWISRVCPKVMSS